MKANKFVIIPIILVAAFAVALILSNFLPGTVNLGPIFGSTGLDCSACTWGYSGGCGCGGNWCSRLKACPQNPACNQCVPATFCSGCGGTTTTTCTPNCAGKNCGSNGCGGSCGTCPAGQSCVSGICRSSADTQAPFFYKQSENATNITQNGAVLLSVYWTDNVGLSTAQLKTNETGTWNFTSLYGSPIVYSTGDTGDWSNFTWSNSSIPVDTVVGWYVLANDTSNNVNTSYIETFEIVQTTTTTTATTSTTTTTTPPSQFTFSNFTCNDTTKVASITYDNNANQPVVVVLYLLKSGHLYQVAFSQVASGSGTLNVPPFSCSSLPSGSYDIMFQVFLSSDTSYNNPIASPTATAALTCP